MGKGCGVFKNLNTLWNTGLVRVFCGLTSTYGLKNITHKLKI